MFIRIIKKTYKKLKISTNFKDNYRLSAQKFTVCVFLINADSIRLTGTSLLHND